jgi:hypothetical protein
MACRAASAAIFGHGFEKRRSASLLSGAALGRGGPMPRRACTDSELGDISHRAPLVVAAGCWRRTAGAAVTSARKISSGHLEDQNEASGPGTRRGPHSPAVQKNEPPGNANADERLAAAGLHLDDRSRRPIRYCQRSGRPARSQDAAMAPRARTHAAAGSLERLRRATSRCPLLRRGARGHRRAIGAIRVRSVRARWSRHCRRHGRGGGGSPRERALIFQLRRACPRLLGGALSGLLPSAPPWRALSFASANPARFGNRTPRYGRRRVAAAALGDRRPTGSAAMLLPPRPALLARGNMLVALR